MVLWIFADTMNISMGLYYYIIIIEIKVKNYEESLASSPDEDCAGGEEL